MKIPIVFWQRDGCGVPVVSHVQQGEKADLAPASVPGPGRRPEDPDRGDLSHPHADEQGHG